MKPDTHPTTTRPRSAAPPAASSSRWAPRRKTLRVDICSNCHPFYTGKQTIVDTAGQVERFQKRLERSAKLSRP